MPSNNFARKSMEKSRISLGLGGNSSSEKWSIGWHMVDFKRESLEGITLTGMKLKVDYNDTNNESNEYLEKSVPLRSRRSTNKICSTPIHSARCSKNFTLGLSPILPNTSLDDSVASSKSTVPEEIEGCNVDEEVENIIDRIRKTPGKSKSRISEYLSVPEAVDDGRKTPVKAKTPALEVDKNEINEIQKTVPEPLLLRTPKQGKSGIPVRKPQTPFKLLREEKKHEKGEEEPVNEVGLEIERRVEKDSKLHDLLLLNGSFKNDSLRDAVTVQHTCSQRLEKSLSKSEHTLHSISTKSRSIKSVRTSLRKKKSLEVLLKSIGENLANQSKSSRHSKSKLEEESKQNDQGNMTETRNNNTTQNNKTTATRRRSRSIKENENQDNLLSPVLNRSGKGNRSRSRSNKSGTSTNKSTQKITEDDKEVKHIQEEADVKSPVLNKSGQRKPRSSSKNKSSENNETTEIDDEKEGVQKSPILTNKSDGKRTSKRNNKSTHNTQEIENEINVQNLKIAQTQQSVQIEQPKNDDESIKIIKEDKSKIIPEKEESIQIVNNPYPQTNYSISGKDNEKKSFNDSDNSKKKDESIIKTDDNNDCVDLQEVAKEQKQDELIVINNDKSPSKSSSPKKIKHHEPVEQENEFKEFMNEDDERELENAHQSLFNVSGRRSYRRVETPIPFEVQSNENEKEQNKSARKSHHRDEAQIPVDVSTQVPSKENTNIVGSNSNKSHQVQTTENEQNKSGRKSSHKAETQIPVLSTQVPSKESHQVETQIPIDVSTQVPSKENTYIVGSNTNKSHQVQTTENVDNEQNKTGRKSSHQVETQIPVDVSTQVPSKENTYIAGSNSNKSQQVQTTENEQNKSGRKSSHQVETQIPVDVSSKENTYIAGSSSNKSHQVQTTENVEIEQNKSGRKSSHKVETQIPVDVSTQVPSKENTYIVGSNSNKSQAQTTENIENEQNKSGKRSSHKAEPQIPVESSRQVEIQIPVDVSTQIPSKENSFGIVGSSSNKSQENLVEQNKSCFVVIEESVQINSQDFLPPSNQAIDNVFVEEIQQQNEGEGKKKLEIRTTRSSTARSKQLEKVSLQNKLINKSVQLTPQAIEQPLNTRKGRQEIEEEQQQTSAPSTNTNFNSNSNKKPGVILNKSPVIEQLIEKERTVPSRKSPAVLSNKAKNSNNKKTRRRYSRKFNKKRSSFNNKSALKTGDKYQLPGDSNSKHIVKPGDETEDESSCNEDRETTHSPGPCRPKRNDFDDPEIHNKISLNLFDVSCNIGDNDDDDEEKKSSAAVTMHKKTEVNKVVKEILQDFSSDSEDERSRYVLKSHTPTPTKGRRMSRRNLHRLFDSLVSKTLSSANNTFASPVSNEPSSSSSSAMVNKSRRKQSLNLRKSSSLSRKSLNQRKSKNKSLRKSEADNVNVNREASVREEVDDVQNEVQEENKNSSIVEEDLAPVVSQIVEEKIVVQGDTNLPPVVSQIVEEKIVVPGDTNLPPVVDVDIREDVEFNFNENEQDIVNESISNRIDEQRTKQQSVEEEVKENIPPSQVVAVESYVEPNSLPPPPPHSAPSSSVSISTSNKPKRRGRPAGSKSKMTESILPQIYIPDETAEISDIRQPRKRKVGFYCNGVLIYQDKAIVEKMLNACSTSEPQQKKKRQSKKINTTAASSIHGESIALEKEEETAINENKSINQKKKNNNNSNKRQSKMKLNIIKENENDEGSSSCSATADVAGSSGEKNNFNSCRVVLQKIDLNNQQIDQYENEKTKRKSVKSPKRSKRLKNDKEKGRKKQELERQLSLIEENVEHIIETHTNENKINRLSIDNNDDNIGEEALTGFSENTETSSVQRNSIGGDNLMLTTTSDKSINKSIDIPGVGSNTVLSCGNGHISGICKLFPSAQFKKNRHKRHNMEFQLMSGKGVLDITGTSKTRMKINKSYVVQKGSSYSLINQSDKEDMVICYKKFSSNDTNDQTSL